MAEDNKSTEESGDKKINWIKKIFHPTYLKRIIISLAIIVVIIAGIYFLVQFLFDEAPADAPFWYRKLGDIKFTSNSDPTYGTFYCKMKISLAYNKKSFEDVIDSNKVKILDAIRKTISNQNYYYINDDVKREVNLVPVVVRELNLLLSSNKGRFVTASFPAFRIVPPTPEQERISIRYFNLGKYNLRLKNNKSYSIESYVLINDSSDKFNQLFNKHLFEIKKIINNNLIIQKKEYEIYTSERFTKDKIIDIIKNTLNNYFNNNFGEEGVDKIKKVILTLMRNL